MRVLGINAIYHDPSAALVVDGEVVAASEEERFSRRKHGKRPVPFSAWEVAAPMPSAALGREWSDDELASWLRGAAVPFTTPDDLPEQVAEILARDGVVAWFDGRAEFGPRALGQRSLLAHPGRAENLERLDLVKGREQFRPVAPMALALRVDLRVAVHLRRRGQHEARTLVLREAERVQRPDRAHLERLDGQLQVVDRRGGRREVQHEVDRPGDVHELGHVAADQVEPGFAHEVGDVGGCAGEEAVEADDLGTPFDERGAQVAAEEPRAAGDDGPPGGPVVRSRCHASNVARMCRFGASGRAGDVARPAQARPKSSATAEEKRSAPLIRLVSSGPTTSRPPPGTPSCEAPPWGPSGSTMRSSAAR